MRRGERRNGANDENWQDGLQFCLQPLLWQKRDEIREITVVAVWTNLVKATAAESW